MNKKDNINKIFYYTKGKEYEKPIFREFWVKNGIMTLREEQDNGNIEPLTLIFKHDETQINEFQSNVLNEIWKPSLEFMNKNSLKFTEAFKQKFLDNRTKTDKREGKNIIIEIANPTLGVSLSEIVNIEENNIEQTETNPN